MFLFDWATMPAQDFGKKLAIVWLGFYCLLGLPVSAFTFDMHKELGQCLAAASAGSTFILTVLVWRLYLVSVVSQCGCGCGCGQLVGSAVQAARSDTEERCRPH
jgi:hypothetical protein